MLIRTAEGTVDRPSLWRSGLSIVLLDQTVLPSRVDLITVTELHDMAECIRMLRIRGAPAIGAFGALSLAVCLSRGIDLALSYDTLVSTRPTAVDLRNCLDLVKDAFERGGPAGAVEEADRICASIVESCRRIGEAGAPLFRKGERILTHCNAGALATIDWGTALSPIRVLARKGMDPFVYVSETRPLLQGARLTAWELTMEAIPHMVLADSACAHLMREGMVDSVIVGADRVCRNGDVANKVGTLDKAILANRFDIPFYVAFPHSTFDRSCASGKDVPIEMRGPEELGQYLRPGVMGGSDAWNPAFDWTPADLITAFITERGIVDPEGIGSLLP